ncbi:uncharacterized protein LOC118757304, partial [Rhagoletis pomonella]|uniref:uncharacterized protein LOC118757304 n=1 Tax=Rhagoletis pomonella TaxID=28610 RepID=UPI00177FBE71
MEVTNLIRTRGQIKGSFTKYRSYVLAATESTSYEALKIRCDRLDALWEEFVDVDKKIASHDDQVSEYSSQEDVYLDLKERFLVLLATRSTPSAIISSTGVEDLNTTLNRFTETQRSMLDQARSCDTRLPKLDIPAFHGEYCKWPTFKDLFLNTVHNVNTISKSRKFQYLQMYLKGDAETVISGIVCSNEAYDRAWSKLFERYDKQKPIIISYIKSFFELKSVVEPSAVAIRTLADNTDCILRGLKSLGADAESRDPWIIYMLLKKLDDDTKRQWAESDKGSKDHPKIEEFIEFIEFLNKRWSALECMQSYKSGASTSFRARCFIATDSNHTPATCASCDGAHHLYKCPKFKSLGVTQKREFVNNHNLCYNCLSGEHRVSNCTSKQKCHLCGRQHHSCLHIDAPSRGETSNSQPPLSTFSIQSNNMVNQRVALPTAVVKASNTNTTGATVCKVLMDSASMGTFVSEDLVQRLRLSRRNGRIKVGGIGGAKSIITRGIVSLQLTSRFDSNVSVNIDAFILNRISHQDKSDPVNTSHCGFPPNLNMADDGSLISQPIDVLIGSQHFFDFLTDGKFTSKTGFPTIQNTIFGYVLAGKVHNGGEDICSYSVTASINDFKIDQALRRFWEIENEPQVLRKFYTPEEQFCENHFQKTHGYDDAGRYIVKLPFRDDSPRLGDSYTSARKQFASLERRFERDESLFNQYKAFMEEYIALGHMEKIPASEVNKSCEK